MGKIVEFTQNLRYAFRPHKPLLLARLAHAVIKSYLFKRPPLRYVDFAVDFACNLKCEHCFAEALRQEGRRRMQLNDYERVAEECMKLGVVNFSFQGGEPLLYPNLKEIIRSCHPERNVISVTTNGTLLTKEKVEDLKRLGIDILTVSLDSAIAEEHDRFRGVSGTFEKTMTGINLALKKGLRVTLGAVVTHRNLMGKGITDLINLAKRLKTMLYLILPVPAGRWVNNKEIFLTKEDLEYIDKLTHASRYVRTDFQANLGRYGCGAVKEILYLTPYGDVLPCPFLHIAIGNIFKESIANIRNRALENPYFAVYRQECLASADKEFIDRYLSKTFNATQLPLSWDRVFS